MSQSELSIGNAGGYWGDDPNALVRQVQGGRLDYITMDFLAEITMSILRKQQLKDPAKGFAYDFVPMVARVLEKAMAEKTCIISNAGGIHPIGCAKAIMEVAASKGLKPRIAVVAGDDLMGRLQEFVQLGHPLKNMETDQDFAHVNERVQAANVYFGAYPVVKALEWEPDIIVTGRVTDTGLTLAPMIHNFGWGLDDWDRLAAGTVAGHIMECGTQATGGNFTDWHLVQSFRDVGFPITVMQPSGEFTITKHPGSGGLVSCDTVREQLFYEMGPPKGYITPDVVCDFSSIQLSPAGSERVLVHGVKGSPATPSYKVSMAYEDGFKTVGSVIVSGPNAVSKAKAFAEILWERCGHMFAPEDRSTEFVGYNACHRSLAALSGANEVLVRVGARSMHRDDLGSFAKMIPSLILAGPPGVAVTGGVPKVTQIMSYWPCLLDKSAVYPVISLYEDGRCLESQQIELPNLPTKPPVTEDCQTSLATTAQLSPLSAGEGEEEISLERLCLARSGDKGDTANIGVLARSPEVFAFLRDYLTAQRVKNMFHELCFGVVHRYELENMLGFNFLLEESLGGGGTRTLRIDAQGKTFAQAILQQKVSVPTDLLATIASS